ncbi:MAG: diguanylate cyclase [Sulfurimonas sp.]|nr:diguanylate cyclase [Sulfurimonas sp.]
MKQFLNLKLATMAAWILILFISLALAGYTQYKHSVQTAKDVLDANFNNNRALGKWATSHGGVYVPVDMKRTPPSPYLADVLDRDIQTPSGKKLTLMHPSYMLRQINDESIGLYGVDVFITAIETLNPHNAPDEWELKALKTLKNDSSLKEVVEFADIDGEASIRLMRPMNASMDCLRCHAHQKSYYNTKRVGGVSVSLPVEEIKALGIKSFTVIALIHLFLLVIGLIFIEYIYRKKQKIADDLDYIANHDSLTSLANRHAYNRRLDDLMADNKVNNISIIFMDLDDFKKINDTLGHTVGDILLQSVAARLKNSVPEFDTLARFGGDEFVFIFVNIVKRAKIENIAKNIHKVFQESFALESYDVYTSASIGIASYPQNAMSADALLKNADIAMYYAKNAGKNKYVFYIDEMSEKLQESLVLEGSLRKALERDELFFYSTNRKFL